MRVGIDQTYGKYNAPINPNTNDYLYLPIPQDRSDFISGMETTYDSFIPYFDYWCRSNETTIDFPDHLRTKGCHLDPDFFHSTYGDQATGRGARVATLKPGDFLAFFASFKPIADCEHSLIYALYGIMVIEKIVKVGEVIEDEFHMNAHTRIKTTNPDHWVVFANQSLSGRFSRAIPIGEFRNGAYRVKNEILDAWGGIDVKDGFIQRSVCPPSFYNSVQFLSWLAIQNVALIQDNYGQTLLT